ncbi:alpha/beta hydrolase [Herbihabitans rhizosphaerae]|uniref:alpha/beta fold hydrolase n=1 Tax=Herbihabitans rhizosphaerae TaxID=1872711 RepID=UPI0030FEFB8E
MVLLHAFPLDSRMWEPVRSALAEHAQVITPDQRGMGRSPLGTDAPSPSLDIVAADVLSMLDGLGVERAVFGGCSMGGYVAMEILRAAPERVAGLVLADTRAGTDPVAARENRLAVADRLDAEGLGEWLVETFLPLVLGRTSREGRPEVVEAARRMLLEQPAAGAAWAQRAMAGRRDSTALLGAAGVPVLVVGGEEDVVSTPDMNRELVAGIAGAELRLIPECGHLPSLEAPGVFASLVIEWFSRVQRS